MIFFLIFFDLFLIFLLDLISINCFGIIVELRNFSPLLIIVLSKEKKIAESVEVDEIIVELNGAILEMFVKLLDVSLKKTINNFTYLYTTKIRLARKVIVMTLLIQKKKLSYDFDFF